MRIKESQLRLIIKEELKKVLSLNENYDEYEEDTRVSNPSPIVGQVKTILNETKQKFKDKNKVNENINKLKQLLNGKTIYYLMDPIEGNVAKAKVKDIVLQEDIHDKYVMAILDENTIHFSEYRSTKFNQQPEKFDPRDINVNKEQYFKTNLDFLLNVE
jgi:hypothetical protein